MLALPRMSRNEAQARSLIASRSRTLRVFGNSGWSLTLEPASLACPPPGLEPAWLIHADWSGARFVLEVPDQACVTWINRKLPDLDVVTVPEPLLAAALEAAMAEVASGFRPQARRGRLQVASVQRAGAPPGLAHVFLMHLTQPQTESEIRALLHVDALGLLVIAGLVNRIEPGLNTLPDDSVRMPLRLAIGTTVLGQSALAALGRHDIVLIEECWLNGSADGMRSVLLIAGDGRVRVGFDGVSCTVLEPWEKAVNQAAGDPDDDEPLVPPGRLDANAAADRYPTYDGEDDGADADALDLVELEDLPVRLVFDLGERMLTLGELRRLQPGHTFDLGRPLAGAVRIRANGALVGVGELVEIDGRLGVAVLRIGGTGSAAGIAAFEEVVPPDPAEAEHFDVEHGVVVDE